MSAPRSVSVLAGARLAGIMDPEPLEPIAENGEQGDARIRVYDIAGELVAETNGDPIWEHDAEWTALPEELRARAEENRG